MSRTRKNMQDTRAAYYGINATALAKDAKTKLGKIRIKVAKLQEPWSEADPIIEKAVEQTLSAIDDLIRVFGESAEYLNEKMDD